MENKKILMLRHSPLHVKFDNPFYVNQLDKDVNFEDVIFIDATSWNPDKELIKDISPFFIGPVKSSDGKECKIFENFWQFNKVYKGVTKFRKYTSKKKFDEVEFVCSDEDGNPSETWFKFRDFGFNETTPYRHPYRGETLYQYYVRDGKEERLSYLDARKKVYIPEYAKLVYNSEGFKKLKRLVDEGKTIALLDFDAYNYYNKDYMKNRYKNDLKKNKNMEYTLEDYLNINNMKDAFNFPGLIVGHGFVLKMMLQGDIEVKDGKVIDHIGVLE